MKEEIWVVTKRGNIEFFEAPEEFVHPEWMTGDITLQFDAFEDARACMQEMLRDFSMHASNIFDGEGGIHGLDQYFEEIQKWIEEHGPINMNRKFYRIICEVPDYSFMGGDYTQALKVPGFMKDLLLEGKIPGGGFPRFRWTDWNVAIESGAHSLKVLYASPTPPFDGYNPCIEIRGFAENDPGSEKVFHIYNELGQDPEFIGSLDIRLWKTTRFNLDCDLESLAERLENEYENAVGFELGRKIPGLIAIDSVRVETNCRFISEELTSDEQAALYKQFIEHLADMAEGKGFVVDRRYWIPTVFKHAISVREEYGDRNLDTVEKARWDTKNSTKGRSNVHCYLLSDESTMVDFTVSVNLNTGIVVKNEYPFVVKYGFDSVFCDTEEEALAAISHTLDRMLEEKDDPHNKTNPDKAVLIDIEFVREG